MEKSGGEPQSFAYSAVEAALAVAFGADATGLLSLRGRLKSFQRNGFTPETPGRGKVIRYTVEDIYELALALALAEFGLPPRIVIKVVNRGVFGRELATHPHKEHDHWLMLYYPSLFYEEMEDGVEPAVMNTISESRFARIKPTKPGSRYALIDLTDLKLRVDGGLKI